MAPVLVVLLASPAAEPPCDARLTTIAKSVHVAQLPAPTGHRQPTLNDLPPSLREEEKSGVEASPTQDPQAGTPNVEQSDQNTGRRRTQAAASPFAFVSERGGPFTPSGALSSSTFRLDLVPFGHHAISHRSIIELGPLLLCERLESRNGRTSMSACRQVRFESRLVKFLFEYV
jgi:hypothetical protein